MIVLLCVGQSLFIEIDRNYYLLKLRKAHQAERLGAKRDSKTRNNLALLGALRAYQIIVDKIQIYTNISYMTIIDIQNQVFQHFISNDIFDIQKSLDSIKFETKVELNTNDKKQILIIALENLKKLEIVAKISDEKWIICRNFLNEPQRVDILPETANMIAAFVNTYRKVTKTQISEVDVLQITDEDIQAICQIGSLLLTLLSNQDKS